MFYNVIIERKSENLKLERDIFHDFLFFEYLIMYQNMNS